ncbi:MAG: hypothetical protein LBV75_03970 [Paludibacter sp.]|jgi:hypothetical protein|nr:hypothetical protein [Paludibacter sp.]
MSLSPSYIYYLVRNRIRGAVKGLKVDNINRKQILATYCDKSAGENKGQKTVIFMCDGKIYHGGLADRLRGLVTVYQACKRANVKFRINFSHPFDLHNYLLPNTYDWEIDNADILYNTHDSIPIVYHQCSPYLPFADKFYRQIKRLKFKQIHYYTNSNNSYKYDFATNFNELFKPSQTLQKLIDTETQQIGSNYIALHFRFYKLLDDFNEVYGVALQSEKEREELIEKCLAEMLRLKERFADCKKFLVCSDSEKFIAAARKFPFVYVVDGAIIHSGNTDDSDFNAHLKTFLDFYLISKSDRVIALTTGRMALYSGFPYCASLVGNVEFERDIF